MVRIVLCLTILGTCLVLGLSILPGALNDLLLIVVLFSVCWLPVIAVGSLIFGVILYRMQKQERLTCLPMKEAIAIPVVIFIGLVLLVYYVPRRIAFRANLSAFEALAANAPSSEYGGVPINARLGVYQVDEFAADPRGGVFFRVYSGSDGLGPDIMSYGFVKHPNQSGTPFGAAHYKAFRMTGDWYWFRASNDWH